MTEKIGEPATPETVAASCPPPSYEEVMGHQTVGYAKATSPADLPPLSYIDIMPRLLDPGHIESKVTPQFDKFSVVIQAANMWLAGNPSYAVWKCETVERKVDKGAVIVMEKMIYHEATFGFNVFIRGLRLWLTKKTNPSEPVQQLGLMNVVPQKVAVVPTHMGYGPQINMNNGIQINIGRRRRRTGYVTISDAEMLNNMVIPSMNVSFEGLQTTLNKLNEDLKSRPLPGTVLNVETTTMKTFEGFGGNGDMDPDQTCWHEDGNKYKRFTQIIRVFYVIGQPANEQIMIEDFIPQVTRRGDLMKASQFETWPKVMSRVSTWIPNQQGIRIVNLQTQYTKYTEYNGEVRVASDSTDDYVTNLSDRKLIKLMRVFYVTRPGPPSPQTGHLSARTFLPVRKSRRDFESMSETMFRITAWLKVTGMQIFSVETHQFLFVEGSVSGVEQERCNIINQGMSGKHFITAISVYFAYPFQEPHASYLPPVYTIYDPNNSQSSSCVII
ncbi:LOW QUALITY PROTEIN: uncharacterized protein LOC117342736 [Pecten maximus]|uniref:LOW QUALITY PROTEIN: uncharacterized protein LOC117342736 n=1 Tax=Pecten maximus TaxID=6579 RepID=UPI001457E78A|nr:LOW QUALITY PROTEIN: uncharacterized protein LOC117342736 [Pecten maximus]